MSRVTYFEELRAKAYEYTDQAEKALIANNYERATALAAVAQALWQQLNYDLRD